jgi:hypothetical protein
MEGQGEYGAYGGTKRIWCLWRDKENIVLMVNVGGNNKIQNDK